MLLNNKEVLGNELLAKSGRTLTNIEFLEKYLDLNTSDILSFSGTCQAARRISFRAIKKSLLTAAVCGNEALARKIVTSHPELLLDSSSTVTDLSGKRITNLTPLQVLICAGDVDMVQMIIEVLQHKLQVGIPLSFNPELEIQRQIASIYPNGDINAKEAEQMATAEEFKTSTLRDIFTAIYTATENQVQDELDNPGQHTDSDLNAALNNFRAQFATTANSEQISNPFYLLKAFEFYEEQFNNFNGNADSDDQWNRRTLFWSQIIGYIQLHLPACLLQAFAQGIDYIAKDGEKLKRDFEFRLDEGYSMRPDLDLDNLGYQWACCGVDDWGRIPCYSPGNDGLWRSEFENLLRTKKSGLENLRCQSHNGSNSRVTYLPNP